MSVYEIRDVNSQTMIRDVSLWDKRCHLSNHDKRCQLFTLTGTQVHHTKVLPEDNILFLKLHYKEIRYCKNRNSTDLKMLESLFVINYENSSAP